MQVSQANFYGQPVRPNRQDDRANLPETASPLLVVLQTHCLLVDEWQASEATSRTDREAHTR